MAKSFNSFQSHDKILHYPEKINLFVNSGKTLIVTEFDLTNKCNNRCPNCTGINENNEELTFSEIETIVSALKRLDNQGVIISGGGEPLMHKDFIKTLEIIRANGMKIGVNSNGLALTRELAESIAEHCVYFRISLDAGTAPIYKQTHGMEESAFHKVVDNIRLMAKVKKDTGSDVSFTTGFLTSELTKGDMENFVKLSKGCGADAAQFRPFTNDSTDIYAEYEHLKEKYEDISFRLLCSKQKYDKFNEIYIRNYSKCHGMFFSTVITANARMYACLHHRQNENFLICDMRKGEDLVDMWNYKKWVVYHDMDMSSCPAYCRNDSFSSVLSGLKAEYPHKEFL